MIVQLFNNITVDKLTCVGSIFSISSASLLSELQSPRKHSAARLSRLVWRKSEADVFFRRAMVKKDKKCVNLPCFMSYLKSVEEPHLHHRCKWSGTSLSKGPEPCCPVDSSVFKWCSLCEVHTLCVCHLRNPHAHKSPCSVLKRTPGISMKLFSVLRVRNKRFVVF